MHPHLLRRLAAIVYDAVLLFGVFVIASFPVVLLLGGQAVTPGSPPYLLYLLLVAYLYFGSGWTRGGQTLGMKAWRIRLVGNGGAPVSARAAALRCLVALLSWAALGGGFLWSLVDRQRRCWHDLASGTILQPAPRSGDAAQPPHGEQADS